MTWLMQLVTAALSSLGFSILYNVRGRRLLIVTLGGLLTWGSYLLLNLFLDNEAARYFLAAVIATLYSEIFARVCKTPTTSFLVPSIIPLIPGGLLYYTMQAAVGGQWESFVSNGSRTIALAVSLAAGVMVVSSVRKMITAAGRRRARR